MHPIHRRAVLGTGAAGAPNSRNADTVAVRNPMAGQGERIDPRARNERRANRQNGDTNFGFNTEGDLVEREVPGEPSNAAARWHSSQPAKFGAQNTPWVSKAEFDSSRELVLQVYINSPDDDPGTIVAGANAGGSPFAVDPTIVGTSVIGGCVAIGFLHYGDGGVSRTQVVNTPTGQSNKLAVGGSSVQYGPRLAPKYFQFDDTDPVVRIYRIGPGGPQLTSDRFSNPSQQDLIDVLSGDPTQANIFTNQATCLAFISRAEAASSGGTTPKMSRRFFGMLRVGIAHAHQTLCPIQLGASHVQLNAPEFMQFFQVNNALPGNPILTSGPFPSNLPIPLEDQCGAILVDSNLAIAVHEMAFSVLYYPGF